MPQTLGLPGSVADFRKTCSRLGLRMAVLFGSRATGRPFPKPDSDADIAVLDSRSNGTDRFWRIQGALNEVVPVADLDLVFLSQADALFRHEIMSSGKLIFGRPLDFLEYKSFAYKDWVDSQDLLRLEDTLLAKKLAWLRKTCG
jgi:predicted nucleotidyltransferase